MNSSCYVWYGASDSRRLGDRRDLRRHARPLEIRGTATRPDFLPLSRPSIGPAEIAAVTACLESGWVTGGPQVARFEEAFAGAVGARHAVAVGSATAGLHLAL